MFRTAPTYSRVTRQFSKTVSSQEKWQFCCFWHFWPRDRRIWNLKSRFSEWAPQVHPTYEVSACFAEFRENWKSWPSFYPRFRTQKSENFQKSLFWPETSYVGWTWGAYSEKRLFKFKIRLSRGQKCQKQQNCHFSWLETDFENFLVTLE